MPKTACSVAGCDRDAKSRGWCRTHYMRWYTTGEAPTGVIRDWDSSRGCRVKECARKHYIAGYCRPHHRRLSTQGDTGPAHVRPNFAGDDVTYTGAHIRLRRARGKARQYACSDCGMAAEQWAYQHGSRKERKDTDLGLVYSPDPSDYAPMCITCHMRYDALYGCRVVGAYGEN